MFKCCFHAKKVKFYRSINGILSKLGSAPPINVTLSLSATNCHPILLYGLEALKLNKSDIATLSHPYNSVYMKLFQSFNKTVITLCQYYCGELSFEHLVHIRTLNFYARIKNSEFLPANLLFNWFGREEFNGIASKYHILPMDQPFKFRDKIGNSFKDSCMELINV